MVRQRPKPTAPMVLTPTRLRMLYQLWDAGYEQGLHVTRTQKYACDELCRYGYAQKNPDALLHYRITEEGADRLLAPMRLYYQARSHLKVIK